MIIEGTGGWKHKPCSAYRPEDEARCANEATDGDLCSLHAHLRVEREVIQKIEEILFADREEMECAG